MFFFLASQRWSWGSMAWHMGHITGASVLENLLPAMGMGREGEGGFGCFWDGDKANGVWRGEEGWGKGGYSPLFFISSVPFLGGGGMG